MNKKVKLMLIFLISIMIVFFGYLSYYKFVKSKENNVEIEEPEYKLGDNVDITYEIDYTGEYKESIINERVKEVEYFVTNEDEAIYGKLFIDVEDRLYIYDESNNKYKLLLNGVKFKTLNNIGYDGVSGLYVYAISNDGDLYFIYLTMPSIDDIGIDKYDFKEKIDKFTILQFKNYLDNSENTNIVLTTSGKMIDVYSGVAYNPNIVNAFNEYLIFEDNTVCNMSGNWLTDKAGNKIKVKSLINLLEFEGVFKDSTNVIIVTEDNKIIYIKNDSEVYEYGKTISKIEYDGYEFNIYFTDKTSISFMGLYDEDIYPIK